MRYSTLTRMADQIMMYKYIVKNVCAQNGYTATFMPKPMFGDNGSGMHVHMSLWNGTNNLFFDKNGYALISETARWYIGGLIKHAAGVLAFSAPATNNQPPPGAGDGGADNPIFFPRKPSAVFPLPDVSTPPQA